MRPSGASFTSLTIERVNVHSGAVEVLYQARDGAHVGVVTVSPDLPPRYVCIHGPEHPDAHWHYDFHHRRGVIVQQGIAENLDAIYRGRGYEHRGYASFADYVNGEFGGRESFPIPCAVISDEAGEPLPVFAMAESIHAWGMARTVAQPLWESD